MGGNPASAPAMSNPTHPGARYATVSSAISRDRAAVRIAVSSARTRIGLPRPGRRLALLEPQQHRVDHLVAARGPCSRCSSGANRTSA